MKHTFRFLTLGLCAVTISAAVRPAHAISDEQEIAAGRTMAQQAIQQYGQPLPANDPRQIRVSRIGAMLARQATRRNIPFSYTVLQNDKVLNAFAGPGGPVFVTTKLMATAQNDAELAYVLGHETGHVELRHVVKAAQKSQTIGIGAAILGGILSSRGGQAGDLVGGLVNTGAVLWQKGFSRKEESQADDYGTRAIARLGFDPRAAVSMLGRLGDGPEGLGKYLSDHPTSPARQKAVSAEINRENLVGVAQNNGGPFLTLAGGNSEYPPAFGQSRVTSPVVPAGDAPFNGRVVQGARGPVVLVPVIEMARMAGVQWSARGDGVAVRTDASGRTSGIFRANASRATINGRTAQMMTAAQVVDGQLFAPLGAVSAAVGAHASLHGQNQALVSFADGRSAVVNF